MKSPHERRAGLVAVRAKTCQCHAASSPKALKDTQPLDDREAEGQLPPGDAG